MKLDDLVGQTVFFLLVLCSNSMTLVHLLMFAGDAKGTRSSTIFKVGEGTTKTSV
jgi:hypothetical protein